MPPLGTYASLVRRLRSCGCSLTSSLQYPFQLKRRRDLQVRLRDGVRICAPEGEHLLQMLEEIWRDEKYTLRLPEIPPGATVVDVGANVGVFALWAATRLEAERVIAVEAGHVSHFYLRRNLARSRLSGKIVAVHAACVGGAGERELWSRGSGSGSLKTLFTSDAYGSNFAVRERVRTTTLEELFADHRINRCALLKLDCEGAEYEILLNAADGLLAKVERIALEYHVGMSEATPADLEQRLGRAGFQVKTMPLEDVEAGYMYAWR